MISQGSYPETRRQRTWELLAFLLVLLSLLCIGMVLLGPGLSQGQAGGVFLPASIHSVLQADYSIDPRLFSLPAAGVALIDQVIRDDEFAKDSSERLQAIVNRLDTPVLAVTPYFNAEPPLQPTASIVNVATSTPQNKNTAVVRVTATPTQTLESPATPVPGSPTPVRTPTPMPSPSVSPVVTTLPTSLPTAAPTKPIPTSMPTSSPIVPTKTFTPIPPAATSTPIPPTRTPLPSDTSAYPAPPPAYP